MTRSRRSRSRKRSGTSTFRSTRQRLFHVRESIRSDCDDSGIFRQFFRDDLVERVRGSVVIIEIETTVLDRTESGHPGFLQRLDISTTMFDEIHHTLALLLQHRRDGREHLFHLWLSLDVDSKRMAAAPICFYGC